MPDGLAQDGSWDILDHINRAVDDRVTFLRIYDAEVLINVDPIKPDSGRVLVRVPELGWDDPVTGSWIESGSPNSSIVPAIGDNVIIQFIGGDPDRPIYIMKSHEFGSGPSRNSNPLESILFESNLRGDTIKHNDVTGEFEMATEGLIKLKALLGTIVGEGTEPMVKGAALLTFLTTLITEITTMVIVFNAHVHPGVTSGPSSTGPSAVPQIPPTAPPATILSLLNKLD